MSERIHSDDLLLERINGEPSIVGSTMKLTQRGLQGALEDIRGTALDGIQFCQVDDERSILEAYIPPLLVATRARASFILQQKGESVQKVCARIEGTNADVALVDYKMRGYTGADVVEELRSRNASLIIVGFSSNPDWKNAFQNAGADGFVEKTVDPYRSLVNLSEILHQLRNENA